MDGARAPPLPMVEFGISRVTAYHYMLGTSSVPLMLVMSRKRFDALPADVQALIKKYGGIGLAMFAAADPYQAKLTDAVRIGDCQVSIGKLTASRPHASVVSVDEMP
jgi:hypothetical protein